MNTDDLRGSTPVYTAKDVLIGLDTKVQGIDSKLDTANQTLAILVSQDLDGRVDALERDWQQLKGMATGVKLVVGTSVLSSIAAAVALAKALGAF